MNFAVFRIREILRYCELPNLQYFEWLAGWKTEIPQDSPFQKHKTCPIVWFEKDGKISEVIGGMFSQTFFITCLLIFKNNL